MGKENPTWVDAAAEKVISKMEWVSEKSKDKIPYITINGTHDDRSSKEYNLGTDDGINWWCNGFWGGMMWQMYHATGNEKYARISRVSEEKLDQCFVDYYGLHHDVGFMYLPTAVANYRLTGSEDSRRRGLHAANLLAGRFNHAGKFIRAWNDHPGSKEDNRGWAIIDCLMNIPLLYWASEETGDPRFLQTAMLHADTVMKQFIRADGSVCHIVEFDPVSGDRICDYGGQGYGQGSAWTRGQAWGLYGFYLSYRHTGKQEYLDTAMRIADYFMARIPEDGIIPVDFNQPPQPSWCDDTAAAIAACGLLEIAGAAGSEAGEKYHYAALKLLKSLYENHCDFTDKNDCILTKCTAAYHSREHEFNIIYGDYYFMEALFKLKGTDVFIW